ncbi:hypothetical protein K525DRAFT_274979 [Schizophyllum commune Loenen D]|nr:hypothetical protein K525DRAFT_274979 [Schizophyllum commune Loenen D]
MTIDLTFDLPAIPAGSALQPRASGRAQQTRGTTRDVSSRDSLNRFHEAAMIAGGSGICVPPPLTSHLTPLQPPHAPDPRVRALKNKENKTGFTLIFAVYTLNKPSEGWKEPTGYVNAELIKQHLAPAMLDEKVKLIVCRPPGQVAALAGKKAGDAQGELLGVSKGLNYTPKQASACSLGVDLALTRLWCSSSNRTYFVDM